MDPIVTGSAIQSDVGAPGVPQTISKLLGEANLYSYRPFRVLPCKPK